MYISNPHHHTSSSSSNCTTPPQTPSLTRDHNGLTFYANTSDETVQAKQQCEHGPHHARHIGRQISCSRRWSDAVH
eukprot:4724284-Amphidinium_carterae.1